MATIDLTGIEKPITIYQGSTTEIHFELRDADNVPVDMTGYDLRLQVRPSFDSTSVLINATLMNGKMDWVSMVNGKFKLRLEPHDTASIRFPKDSPEVYDGYYDLEVASNTSFPGTVKPWHGSFSISREITR